MVYMLTFFLVITLIKAVPLILLCDNPFTISALTLVLSVALAHGQPRDKPSIVVHGAVCLNEPVVLFINGFQGQAHSSSVRGSPGNKKARETPRKEKSSSFRRKIKA